MIVTAALLYRTIQRSRQALAGFNVFGYEDARAVIDAAELAHAPVMIMVNRDMVRHMPIPIIGPMLRRLAEEAAVPVCLHLDHSSEPAVIRQAVDWGFSSVMFDGSHLSFPENCERTREVADMAHRSGVSVEGEIGVVPYPDIPERGVAVPTDPEEAEAFVRATEVDALAVSVGTVHRASGPSESATRIDFELVARLSHTVSTPMVIHGTTGISEGEIQRLVAAGICKFNVGTALRNAFAQTLRDMVDERVQLADRVALYERTMMSERTVTSRYLDLFGWGSI